MKSCSMWCRIRSPCKEKTTKTMKINTHDHRVHPEKKLKLDEWPTLGSLSAKRRKSTELLEDQ